ncbi:MAG: general secretion pathway protein GspK [Nitrospirae bacterium]|nr:general secretion pathway protein GspK [Nitrospirota bacterium]
MKSEKGIALLMTLWVLVLLLVIGLNLLLSTRHGSKSTRNFKEETLSYYSAISAYEEALGSLLLDKDPAVDFIDENGTFWTDKERAISGKKTYGNVLVEIKVSDEEARFNINTMNEDMLRKLFAYSRIPEEEIQGLIDSLSDWKDPDDLHHLSGAEGDYYKTLKTPYVAKNSFLDTPDEILLIKGFKPEYLYGSEETSALYPLITTHSMAVNINTASKETLGLTGLSDTDIENIMKLRTKDVGGLRVIPAVTPGIGLTTASSNFRLEITASIPGSSQTVKLTAIVKRSVGTKGPEMKTIYWKEGIESSRT